MVDSVRSELPNAGGRVMKVGHCPKWLQISLWYSFLGVRDVCHLHSRQMSRKPVTISDSADPCLLIKAKKWRKGITTIFLTFTFKSYREGMVLGNEMYLAGFS